MDKGSTEKWYFTFTQKQHDLKNKYVCFEGDYFEARVKMVARFGEAWACQYPEKEFLPQIKEFGLTELK